MIAGSTKLDTFTRRDAQRGTSFERLSGLIRTTVGPPAQPPGPRQPLLRLYRGGRRLGWEPLGRSTTRLAYPGSHQAVSVDLPVGQASGGPLGPRARLEPLWFGKSDHPAGHCDTQVGPGWAPGWQDLQVAQTVATDSTPS